MSVFFNGRLITTPSVNSVVVDSALANPNPNVGNVLALIGPCTAGQPNTPLAFGNSSDAVAALGSGDLVDAITRAFNPSNEVPGPQTIIAVRVNPAVQSALTLLDGSAAAVINLASADYGQYTNQIKVKIEAGTTNGLKVTTQLGTSYFSQDNIYRAPFSIQYTGGQASAKMSITNTQLTLQAPTGTVVATIDLTAYNTVQKLVDYINTVSGFGATVLNALGATSVTNALDSITNQDVRTAVYTATATLQAVVDWFNGLAENFVTATRVGGAGTLPAVLPFTYLSGGSDGTVTNTQYSNAFTTLQTSDVQWVTPCTGDQAVAAMADAHVQYMSNVMRMERRAICGMVLGSTDAQAIAAAANLNSDRTSLTHLGGYDYNAAGVLTLYAPYIVAAMIAGAFSGVSPGTPMTNKSLTLRGLERLLRNPTDTDALIQGGVLCVSKTSTGYRVVKSISTWLTNSNFNRVEQSTGAALDYAVRAWRQAVANIKGSEGGPAALALAISQSDTALRACSVPAPVGPGALVGDANSPAFRNLTGAIMGDVLSLSAQLSPGIPVNYVDITVYAVPYSGSLSA